MNVFRAFFNIRELFFPLLFWIFIYTVFFSLSWFFNEPINPMVHVLILSFLLSLYFGYLFSSKYAKYYGHEKISKKVNILTPALIGFASIAILFLLNIANLGKNLAVIREERFDQSGFIALVNNIYIILFPLFLFAFILANFNDFKYKRSINIMAIFICLAFIPINGGRVNIIVFATLYLAIYFFKNFLKIKSSKVTYFFKFLGGLFLVILVGAGFSFVRLDSNSDYVLNELYRLEFVSNSGLSQILKLPYGIGVSLASLIYIFYDYTGGNIYYLSIFYDNAHLVPDRTYGIFNFGFFARFTSVDWLQVHDKVDNLYLKYDVKYNVWSSAIRDLAVDFGFLGTFVVIFFMSILMFSARQFIYKSFSAQLLYFHIFAFFLFSPFHSLFYISPSFGLSFLASFGLFLRYQFNRNRAMNIKSQLTHL